MPRKATDRYWRDRIREIVENDEGASPRTIAAHLLVEGERDGRCDVPSARTCGRIKAAYLELDAEQRAPYRYVTWPDAFVETGLLPPDSSGVVLEMLPHFLAFGRRPTVGQARWYLRLRQAAPGAPIASVLRLALRLARRDCAGDTAAAEAWLAFQPWRGDPERAVYEQAIEDGAIPSLDAALGTAAAIDADADLDSREGPPPRRSAIPPAPAR